MKAPYKNYLQPLGKVHKSASVHFFILMLFCAFLSISSLPLFGQNPINKSKIEIMNGVSIPGQNPFQKNGVPPIPFAICSDMGGESGWGSWQATEGYHQATIPDPIFFTPGVPTAPRFNITSGAGIDPCTPGGGGPAIPLVCPGFGTASIQLGQPNANGMQATNSCTNSPPYPGPDPSAAGNGCSERLTYPLTVGIQDTNFIYAYALVLENPFGGHTSFEAPFAEIYILDANGDTVSCSHRKYTADLTGGVGAGFFAGACTGSTYPPGSGFPPNGFDVTYKPWTLEGINLFSYIGQTLTVVITNSDCAKGGHYCYSYWDFSCGPLSTNPASYCVGNSVSITAPADPIINYTYQWIQNGVPYTGAGSTSQTITPFPLPGDTFAVAVSQPSGCPFYVTYVPVPMAVTPNFNYNAVGGCGNGILSFTDSSYTPNGSPMTSWNWTFPGATPSGSTIQNPSNISYPPGSYTVTLIVTSQQGCTDTIALPVTVSGIAPPTAAFSTGPVCLGSTTSFTNSSVAIPGDPITSWSWNFGDATANSTQQTPSHNYGAPGTYSVTLSATSQGGCVSSVTQTVTVNPVPVASFSTSIVCFNSDPTQFNNLSTGATQWLWNFGDGNTSTLQNPTHTYGNAATFTVTLLVTNAFGCKDSIPSVAVVNPLPVALFTAPPVCAGDPTCFSDASSVNPGTIMGWSWNFGDPGSGSNNTSTSQAPCHTYSGPGPFTVILTATSDSGCQSTTMLPATINPLPTASLIATPSCLGTATTLTNTSMAGSGDPIASWSWSMPGGTPPASSSQNTSTTYSAAGTHSVSLIVTSVKGCKDTVTNQVAIYNLPVADFGPPNSGCAPVCNSYLDSSVSVDGTISNWQWNFPGGLPLASVAQNPNTICYNTPGTYSVSLIVTSSYGCKDTVVLPMIEVYANPTADFCVTPSQAPTTDPVFTFCDQWSNDVVQWSWNFGDNDTDVVSTDPVHSYTSSTSDNDFYSFDVCLQVQNQYGCVDVVCKPVELIPEFTFYIPNTFTPNSDFDNEMFFGKSRGVKEYNIWVFDRWGNQIWDCHHTGKNTDWDNQGQDGMSSFCQWDGKVVRGGLDMGGNTREFVQEDVYVWKVRLTDIFNKKHSYIGHVNVVR